MSRISYWVSSLDACAVLSAFFPDVNHEKKQGLVSLNSVDWELEPVKAFFRDEQIKALYESGNMITDYCIGYVSDAHFSECLLCLEEDNPEELVIKGFFSSDSKKNQKKTMEHYAKILAIVIEMLSLDLKNGGYRILTVDTEDMDELSSNVIAASLEGAVSCEAEDPVSYIWDDDLVEITGNLDYQMMDARFRTIKEKLAEENISYEYKYEDFALPVLNLIEIQNHIQLHYEIIRKEDELTGFELVAQTLEPVEFTEDGEPVFFRTSHTEEPSLWVEEIVEWIRSVIEVVNRR